jgi:predicted TIM-barrel fold metal-dependent hydrolase
VLDDGFEARPDSVPNLKRRPSDILAAGQLFHAVESSEKYLEFCIDELGEDVWLFATDYPHTGSPWPNGVSQIAERPELAENAKVKILGANAQRLCTRIKA